LVFIPIVTAIFIYILEKKWGNYLVFAAQFLMSYVFLRLILIFPQINNRSFVLGDWTLASGIALKIDNLSLAFIGLSIFLWWLVLIYAWEFHGTDNKFLFFLLFLEGTFMGLLMVNDLFSFFIFIDIITILSSILVVYKKDGWSLRSGLYYLLINSMGMLTYLLGFMIIYMLTGTLNWDLATTRLAALPPTGAVTTAYVLMSASVTVKAAFFPTFNWLSRAHGSAPASISALLSGLLVKGGLYGFIRIQELFGGSPLGDFYFYLGFVTALAGIIFAISQKDIKQILAFHTISQVGIILIGISSIQTDSYYGGLIHLFNHAIFKSLLFMGAGVIINHYRTRRLTEIRGVLKRFPLLSVAMFVGILSITGTPFFSGYLGKYVISHELEARPLFYYLFQLINLGTMVSFMKFSQIFFPDTKKSLAFTPHMEGKHIPLRAQLNIPIFTLAFTCIFMTFGYSFLGDLLQAEFPVIHLVDPKKMIQWAAMVMSAFLITRYIIFTDRVTPLMHRIREIKIPFYNTAYMFILLIATMFLFTH
jgi:multicomponent Na+:H+ antiporter subunit D